MYLSRGQFLPSQCLFSSGRDRGQVGGMKSAAARRASAPGEGWIFTVMLAAWACITRGTDWTVHCRRLFINGSADRSPKARDWGG